jgi:glycerophosphoryl diester phosphodiesterase
MGRKIQILIGLHTDEILQQFQTITGHENIPSLCELEPEKTLAINAAVWAPSWTKGLQKEDVTRVQQKGKKAIVWTIDKSKQMKEFMKAGNYDGAVTNNPSLLAYYYYTQHP